MFPSIEIIFRVRLRLMKEQEPSITLKSTDWKIELRDGCGEYLATGYGQSPISEDMVFDRKQTGIHSPVKKENFDKDIIAELAKVPMDVGLAVEGWARFTVSGLMLFHAFGATIKICLLYTSRCV